MNNWLGLPVRQDILAGKAKLPPGFSTAPESFKRATAQRVLGDLSQAINVRIDNVTEYLFNGTDQEEWGDDDFPNQAPPFETMWIETRSPSSIRSRNPPKKAAERKGRLEQSGRLVDPSTVTWGILYKAYRRPDDPPETRWETHMNYFRRDESGTHGPLAVLRQLIGEDGTPYKRGEILIDVEYAAFLGESALEGEDPNDVARNIVSPAFFPVQLAISFMHCKNVRSEEVYPSRQVRRHTERNGEPTVKYHVLDIVPMRKVLETEGGSGVVGIQRAMHICRGHFSEYTEEKPLFGKYAGRFWIPAHVRGTAEAGKIVKDYNVKAPRSAA